MEVRVRLEGGSFSMAGTEAPEGAVDHAADFALTPRVYRAVLIRPGEWKGKGIRCSAEVLRRNAGKFGGLSSFLNPPARQPGQHGYPGLEHLLGVTENAVWDEAEQAVVADYRLADTAVARELARLIDGWLAERAAGHAVPDVGLSAVPWVTVGPADGEGLREVIDIISVEQVDVVYRPAAGGEFVRVVNAFDRAADPQGTPGYGGETLEHGGIEMLDHEGARTLDHEGTKVHEATKHEGAKTLEHGGIRGNEDVKLADAGDAGVSLAGSEETGQMVGVLRESVLEMRLAASGLPAGFQRVVREGLPAAWRVSDLDGAIARVKAAWAEEAGKRTVQGIRPAAAAAGGTIGGMTDGLDQVTEALSALLEGRAPRGGVRPLTGIRDAYLLLSGDYEMTGVFRPERVYLANVSSTTMANIVANALNKIVVQEFQSYPY